jgi:hypothetical protein
MPLATLQFRSLLTNLSHNVRRDAGSLLSRMGHFAAHEARDFITEAWPELLRPYIDAAGELTTEWYDGHPSTNTVFVPQPADPPPDEQLGANGRWAIGQDDPHDALGGAGERAVFNASRDTVLDNVIREDGARWVREARPGACNFCKLMAIRGAVYWTETSALTVVGRTMARKRMIPGSSRIGGDDGEVGIKRGTRDYGQSYHDSCRCIAVPVRPGDSYAMPDYAQSWETDYTDAVDAAKKQQANKGTNRTVTVKDIINAWDRNDREARGLMKPGPKPKTKTAQ